MDCASLQSGGGGNFKQMRYSKVEPLQCVCVCVQKLVECLAEVARREGPRFGLRSKRLA